jgi:two-component system response regulator AtoC
LIAGTQKNLAQLVKEGRFRADLYYALNVVPIQLPALRSRREDLRALTEHFCSTFARQHEKKPPRFSADAWAVLEQHSWPGNVRELSSSIERLVVLYPGETLSGVSLSAELLRGGAIAESTSRALLLTPEPAGFDQEDGLDLESRVRKVECDTLAVALRKAGGNRSLAARILGVSRRTLYNKLAQYDLTDLVPPAKDSG